MGGRSRTFMRLLGGRVRLLVVDEPSSALDPAAEHALFERLRAMRAGKTMVFVTHRFQHLTRHADLILCVALAPALVDADVPQVHEGWRARRVGHAPRVGGTRRRV